VGDVVVDDHLLLRILLDDEPSELRLGGGRIATTGLWYHRLGRALADTTITGTMSQSLGDADPQLAAAAVEAVTELPETISLTSLRSLAWPMANLVAHGERLNLLSLEALAAAQHLGAELCLAAADENPPLVEAARRHDVSVRVVMA
jgi:hypothetical protein